VSSDAPNVERNCSLNSIAQQQNGTTIVLEHRFYGLSNPLPDLSVKSFRLHTIQQAIDDFEYFAKNVNLPMPGGDSITPDKAPWILIGGSYSGAQFFLLCRCSSRINIIF
jgi:hypothetical protein